MTSWCAVSFGALDLRETPAGQASGAELAVTPIYPGEPVTLSGAPAALWRRLVDGPVADEDLSPEDRDLVGEFEEYGIASREADGPHVTRRLDPPWLSSPTHELVYALVANLAAELQIDALFIKGPTLRLQGLRAREHSGDVDVWVSRSHVDALSTALGRFGWSHLPNVLDGTRLAHSRTLKSSGWGCEVDVHSRFPGFVLEEQRLFKRVLDGTIPLEFAGAEVRVPSPPNHAVIEALHLIRPRPGIVVGAEEFRAAATVLRLGGKPILRAATDLGAVGALRSAMVEAFPEAARELAVEPVPTEWAWRSQRSVLRAYRIAGRLLPFRERLILLQQLAWPPIDQSETAAPRHGRGLDFSHRLIRLVKGWRKLSRRPHDTR